MRSPKGVPHDFHILGRGFYHILSTSMGNPAICSELILWLCSEGATERSVSTTSLLCEKETRCTASVLLRIALKHSLLLGNRPGQRYNEDHMTPECNATTPECSEMAFIILCVFIVVISRFTFTRKTLL